MSRFHPTPARTICLLAGLGALATLGIGGSVWGVLQLRQTIVESRDVYRIETVGSQKEIDLTRQTAGGRRAVLPASGQMDAQVPSLAGQFSEPAAPEQMSRAERDFESLWDTYLGVRDVDRTRGTEAFLTAERSLQALKQALADHARIQSGRVEWALKSCIVGLAFFLVATLTIMFALIRVIRSRDATARSLGAVNQELATTQELDRRRVAILEMVSAHAPLSISLAAVADLAGQVQPGAGAAIWSVGGEVLLYQVSAGLPAGLRDLVRAQVFELTQAPHEDAFRPAAHNAGLSCVPTALLNAAGDSIGLLILFVPEDTMPSSGGHASILAQLASLAIENALLYERLAFQAQHDMLTGLPNRLLFQDRVQQAIRLAGRNGRRVAVLWVDVDRFKHINDTIGHRAGDELLCEVARRLRRSTRESDTAARLGGDEFVVLANDLASGEDGAIVAQKIIEAMREPMTLCGQEVKASVSVGISVYPEHGMEAAALMRHADLAMYKAKRAGRDVQQMFLPQFGHSLGRRLEIERELKNALSGSEFHLEYQPLIGRFNQIESVEALLRWNNATLGSISPGEFIPVAEEAGLICALGRWVAREACRQGAEWLRSGVEVPRIAINASGIQIADRGFAEMIHEALEEFAFPPAKLEIEVTETALVDNLSCALEQILDLRELGIRFAIDDFGTGYSSLNQLRTLPVDSVKVDRSFIKDLREASRDTTTLVRGIIGLAHSLQLEVVAEGVETQQQLSLLRSLGCDTLQGFFLHRPLKVSAVEELMRKRAEPVAEGLELVLA